MSTLRRRRLLPRISETERAALEAGDVWVEREFFSGKPDLARLRRESDSRLTEEEQAFLDGPVETLCRMVNDWTVWRRRDLPPEAWEFIKRERFWGMIIPKRYGGLGFGALAHSEVIMKLASRSLPLSITVMVPNSLGPAELLIRYGTEEQKDFYLPRLARGEEIPCFALTEPGAGSDAASIRSSGVVFESGGKLYLRLNWNKRWITLAAVSTVLGIAFRLRDPENHLGKDEELGITCALVPSKTPGVVINRRHDPLRVPFYNSPTQGKDVIVPIENIIGGPAQAGQGWKMLMECLAAGRGISLPAQSSAGAKYVTRVASAHCVVRKQFSTSIGDFEGIEQALARIAGFTYLLDAARRVTCGAIDRGIRPPIITALEKYHSTEIHRRIINHGMDIAGGSGITLGPRNLLAHAYIAAPISITVEGANILTRSLIIFGQGAIRAHPYLLAELSAAEAGDLAAFDRAFWSHAVNFGRNWIRSALLSVTRAGFVASPVEGPAAPYWRKLSWASSLFSSAADFELARLGGKIKTREALSGRFADILSWMYLVSCALNRFEAEGRIREDISLMRWCAEFGFAQIQTAFEELFENGGIPLATLLRVNPIGRPPSDALSLKIAREVQTPGPQRDERLTGGIFIPRSPEDPFYRLERAFRLVHEARPALEKLRAAKKDKRIHLSQEERDRIAAAESARCDAIQVDDFSFEDYYGAARSAA